MVFKNGSIILRFRSSRARRSLSLLGIGTSEEMSTLEKIPARAVSTACRRAMSVVAAVSDTLEIVDVRVFRQKLPPDIKAAAGDTGVDGVDSVVLAD